MQIIEVRKKDTYLRKPGFSLLFKNEFQNDKWTIFIEGADRIVAHYFL